MSGQTCGDIGGKDLGSNLCLMPDGHNQAGWITYRDGRVAEVLRADGAGNVVLKGPDGEGEIALTGLRQESIDATRNNQGSEIGDCHAQGMGGRLFTLLQTRLGSKNLDWSSVHLSEIFRALGQADGQSGNAFLCSNREDRGRIAVNTDGAHRSMIVAAIKSLESSCGKLDGDHCAAVKESLRYAVGYQSPPSGGGIMDMLKYLLGGIAVFVFGGFGAHLITRWWDNRGGPQDPPSGSGGGSREVGSPNGQVVQNGDAIGGISTAQFETSEDGVITGETNPGSGNDTAITPLPDFGFDWDNEPTGIWEPLPDGVVTIDEGALIYAPEYQATVDGHVIAFRPGSGLEHLAGGNYTRAEFMKKAAATPMSFDVAAAQSLFGGDSHVNYGALGYDRSTNAAISLRTGVATPTLRGAAVPLTFGSGNPVVFRAPSFAGRPSLAPAR